MAHAAVISLKQTLNRLLNSSPTPLVSSAREILQVAYDHTKILQHALQRFSGSSSSERLDVLECEIRDCAYKLEDTLDFHDREWSELESEIASFSRRAAEMADDYIEQLLTQPVEDDAATASSNVDSNVTMVGRSSELAEYKRILTKKMRPDEECPFFIVGEVGSGRTILAKTVFDNLRGRGDDRFFDCGAWVTIGPTYEVKEVLIKIISQVVNKNRGSRKYKLLKEQKLRDFMYRKLEHRRYLIVLDDVHDLQILYRLAPSLPQQRNGSAVLITTSNPAAEVGVVAGGEDWSDWIHVVPTAMNVRGWVFLRLMMFGEESISPELEEVGKKIAENCGGRRISLAKTILYLFKTEKTVEEWSKIAADKENPIFMVGDEILEKREIEKELQKYTKVQDEKEDEDKSNSVFEMLSTLVNFSYHMGLVKRKMYPKRFFPKLQIISFYGMAGIGKSTFVKEVWKDKLILDRFDYWVWITLGPKYRAEEILIDILAQIHRNLDKKHMKEDEELVKDLCAELSQKKGLIVLDDIWSKEPLHHLKEIFPDIKGIALVTTRLAKVAKFEDDDIDKKMELLNKEESWCLLRQQVFREEGIVVSN